MTSTAPNNIVSRTFENYVKARENAERRNKEFVDRLNDLTLAKIKNQKRAERSMFTQAVEKRNLNEVHNQRIKACLDKRKEDEKLHIENALSYQENVINQIQERLQDKQSKEKIVSERTFS